jgi:hypothetical protein
MIVTITEARGAIYTLDPQTKTARRAFPASPRVIMRRSEFNGTSWITSGFRIPIQRASSGEVEIVPEQSLGTREIEGLSATGWLIRQTIPTGQVGNDRPIEVTTERWVSVALQIVVLSRVSDPRTGTVEFRLTNIQRSEPPRELFEVPKDYRIIEASQPAQSTRTLSPSEWRKLIGEQHEALRRLGEETNGFAIPPPEPAPPSPRPVPPPSPKP